MYHIDIFVNFNLTITGVYVHKQATISVYNKSRDFRQVYKFAIDVQTYDKCTKL